MGRQHEPDLALGGSLAGQAASRTDSAAQGGAGCIAETASAHHGPRRGREAAGVPLVLSAPRWVGVVGPALWLGEAEQQHDVEGDLGTGPATGTSMGASVDAEQRGPTPCLASW